MLEFDQKITLLKPIKKYPILGWREWVALPQLGIARIKAKIDTGARTSALHAFSLEPYQENGKEKIKFLMHPFQNDTKHIIACAADVIDKRFVTDSGGHREERFVIQTLITAASLTWTIEITLTERENMLFRMLLGRSALKKRFTVNPGRSFITSRIEKK